MDTATPGLERVGHSAKTGITHGEEKAWYVFTVAARLGRPGSFNDISDQCSLVSLTADEVKSLCCVPNSPISITNDGLLSVSEAAISIIQNYTFSLLQKPRENEKLDLTNSGKRPAQADLWTRSTKTPKLDPQPAAYRSSTNSKGIDVEEARDDSSLSTAQRDIRQEVITKDDRPERTSMTGPKMVTVLENSAAVEDDDQSISKFIHQIIAEITEEKEAQDVVGHLEQLTEKKDDIRINPLLMAEDTKFSPPNFVPSIFESQLISGHSGVKIRGSPGNKAAGDEIEPKSTETMINATTLKMGHNEPSQNFEKLLGTNFSESENGKEDGCGRLDTNKVQQNVLEPCGNLQKESFVLNGTDVKDAESILDESLNRVIIGDSCHSHDAENKKKEKRTSCRPVSLLSVDHDESKQNLRDSAKPSLGVPSEKTAICKEKDVINNNVHEKEDKVSSVKRKSKRNEKGRRAAKNETESARAISVMRGSAPKRMPTFKSFTIKSQEGSGGYGTVYKAQRIHDGKMFAIKCPLEKTPASCVRNEIKMLERFGGRDYVIKFEGVAKDNDCDCVILEYVEHDKPEVLKREINVLELQWYGYCMFRALQGLHDQGVIHRDVKPGNFLFSRKRRKGYLIDFNLALDQFDPTAKKTKAKIPPHRRVAIASERPPLFNCKSVSDTLRQKNLLVGVDITKKTSRDYGIISSGAKHKREDRLAHRNPNVPVNMKSRINVAEDGVMTQGKAAKTTDMHLLMSPSQEKTKDLTSTRTPSGGKSREPLPNQGRKELLNLLHEAQQSPHGEMAFPVSQRKRIAAPQEKAKVDDVRHIAQVSPMPVLPRLNSSAPYLNRFSKYQRGKREGPCVGTKGYRAPEVLLRSLYQGPKVDVWSAGISLLYLTIGKTPFQTHNSEHAIKDIAKLFGKEAVWELAKLHERESSLPEEFYTCMCESLSIEEWCRKNTRRPEFLDGIPSSFFDLLNKCLCINPRLRIGAEQALQHEFFSPCRKELTITCVLAENP